MFAEAQRKSVADMEVDIPGGKAGQSVSPCRGTLHLYLCALFVHSECLGEHTETSPM